MIKLILALTIFASFSTYANSGLLGPEHTKKLVKYSLWYEGVQLPVSDTMKEVSVSTQNHEASINEELFIALEKLDS